MRIRAGCELSFEFSQTMPMIVTLTVHFSRFSDLERPDHLMTIPSVPIEGYRDSFGNWCSRLVAPAGRFSLGTDAIVRDAGAPDPVDLNALQHQVQHLPTETLLFSVRRRLLGSSRASRCLPAVIMWGIGRKEQWRVEKLSAEHLLRASSSAKVLARAHWSLRRRGDPSA